MAPNVDVHLNLLREVADHWNRAEANIKRAEQLVDGAMIPSINELRYAGRRLIEAISLIAQDGDSERIQDLLRDARFDCHRAQHDAVDASFQAISIKIEAAVSLLSMNVVLLAFPNYPKLKAVLQRVEEQISESRENRDKRDEIYDSLQKVEFEELLRLFREFDANESTMKEVAKEQRRSQLRNNAFGYTGIALTILVPLATYILS